MSKVVLTDGQPNYYQYVHTAFGGSVGTFASTGVITADMLPSTPRSLRRWRCVLRIFAHFA
jgi:hypothetical protein